MQNYKDACKLVSTASEYLIINFRVLQILLHFLEHHITATLLWLNLDRHTVEIKNTLLAITSFFSLLILDEKSYNTKYFF